MWGGGGSAQREESGWGSPRRQRRRFDSTRPSRLGLKTAPLSAALGPDTYKVDGGGAVADDETVSGRHEVRYDGLLHELHVELLQVVGVEHRLL